MSYIPDSFKLDKWYNLLITISGLILILALCGFIKTVPVLPTIFTSLGLVCIGFGEYINHPFKVHVFRDHPVFGNGKVKGNPRDSKFIGWLIDLIGLAFLVYGIFRFFQTQ